MSPSVSLDDPYVAESGVGVGVTLDQVRRVYGPEDAVKSGALAELLIYDALGVAFTVGAAGSLERRVSGVFIFMPGHSRDIFLRR